MHVLCPAHSKCIIQGLACSCLVHLDVGICLIDMLALASMTCPQNRCEDRIYVMREKQLTLSAVQIHDSKLAQAITIALQSGAASHENQHPFRDKGLQKVYLS